MEEKRLIDASAFLKDILTAGIGKTIIEYSESDIAYMIRKRPTVDAVEVVRCRDCKHSTPPSLLTQRYGVPGVLTCHNHNSPCNKRNVKCEGFCPYGERKDGSADA